MLLSNLRQISRRCPSCFYLKSSFYFKINTRPTSNQPDAIEDAMKIEGSLFENSSRKHTPVESSKKFLKQLAPKENKRPIQVKTVNNRKPKIKENKLIEDTELGLQFSRGGDEFIQLLTAVRSQKRREDSRKIIIEGRRLILEALENNLRMNALLFSQKEQLNAIKEYVGNAQKQFKSKIFKICQHELKMWSTLTTPPGLLGVFEKPTVEQITKKYKITNPLPITVVCDNIREPNNLGSIIRTCAAIPCNELIVTKGCCDPWESKALRGGCGGHFRIAIHDEVRWDELHTLIPEECENDYRVFIAENNFDRASTNAKGKASDYKDLGSLGTHNFVIIGGESHGVSDEAYRFFENSKNGKCLFIPLADGIDSLNVASALTLILYELRTQILKNLSSNIVTNEK